MTETFNLEEFDKSMAELTRLSELQSQIMDKMIRDLGFDPEQLEADAQERKRQERASRPSKRRSGEAKMATDTKARAISKEVRAVMVRCVIGHDIITPPSIKEEVLDRPVYEELRDILAALGGTWKPGQRGFVFADPTGVELADAFYSLIETGQWERPQDYGFFETPEWLADRVIQEADIQPHHRVLEPSAGRGALLSRVLKIVHSANQVATCEPLPANRKALAALGVTPDTDEFEDFPTDPIFDRVVMNPPFGKGLAPSHVLRAMKALKVGGKLVAIMPSSIMQRQDTVYRECRAQIMQSGTIKPLPDDTFKDSGTSVRTMIINWTKPAEPKKAARAPERTEKAPAPVEPSQTPPRRFRRLSKQGE